MNARHVRPLDHRLAAFLLSHGVEGIVHEAILAGGSFLKGGEPEQEPGELVIRYLRA